MDMGRPKGTDYPPYMTVDGDRGGWIVRSPITGKKKRFNDEGQARAAAIKLHQWIENERRSEAWKDERPTITSLAVKWKEDRMPFMPWDDGTRRNAEYMLARIERELGTRVIARTDCMFLEDWMTGFCKTADQWNKWRYVLVLLWRFAVSRKLAATCEPEKIEPRSTSKKLAANRKVRQQLDVAGFEAIHAKAPPWLQVAMEQSLVTLQARKEICNTRYADYRDGYLFVIRDKVSGESDMAFIRIALTAQLDDLRRRSLADGVLSTFLVHRAPDRRRRNWTEGKPHWTYVHPEYLSKAFAEARGASGLYANMEAAKRPTFHEIRGLGARIYRAQGTPEAAIQALMTHAHRRTTQIYLDRGAAALTDDDYQTVSAPLTLAQMLRGQRGQM
jgi:integrase